METKSKNNRLLKIFLICLILLILIVSGVYLFARNQDKAVISTIDQNQIPSSQENESTLPSSTESIKQTEIISSGTFIYIDPLHNAKGNVQIVKENNNILIVFADDFETAQGPDLYVYLSKPQQYRDALNGVDTSKTLSVGKLKSQTGKQIYKVSQDQINEYGDAVVIWCKAFGVQFSRANLS